MILEILSYCSPYIPHPNLSPVHKTVLDAKLTLNKFLNERTNDQMSE